jgi:hypothetical protein
MQQPSRFKDEAHYFDRCSTFERLARLELVEGEKIWDLWARASSRLCHDRRSDRRIDDRHGPTSQWPRQCSWPDWRAYRSTCAALRQQQQLWGNWVAGPTSWRWNSRSSYIASNYHLSRCINNVISQITTNALSSSTQSCQAILC